MKRFYMLLALAAAFTACRQYEPAEIPQPRTALTAEAGAPSDRAAAALEDLYSLLEQLDGPQARSASGGGRTVASLDAVAVPPQRSPLRDAEAAGGADTLLFVASFGGGEGYAILSAVDYIDPVLCITDNGSCNPQKLQSMLSGKLSGAYDPAAELDASLTVQGDPHREYMVEDIITGYVAYKRDSALAVSARGAAGAGIVPRFPKDTTLFRRPDSLAIVADLIPVKLGPWKTLRKLGPMNTAHYNQRHPYNLHTPVVNGSRTLAGCGPVAMAMLIEYWHYPQYIDLSPLEETTYFLDWELMHTVATHEDGYSLGTAEAQDAVAWMMYYVGSCYLESTYGVSSTWTLTSKMISTLERMNYSDVEYRQMTAANDFIEDIAWTRPVLIYGSGSGGGGHFWLVDGALLQNRAVYYMGSEYNMLVPHHYEQRVLYHCNWGWGGSWNGYYLSDMFYYKERESTEPGYDTNAVAATDDPYHYTRIYQIDYSR